MIDAASKNLFSVKQSDGQGLKGQNHECLYLLMYLSSKAEENISLRLAMVVYSNSALQQQDALVWKSFGSRVIQTLIFHLLG